MQKFEHPRLPADYQLLALVGKGSSGLIYKALYRPEKQIVAVKVLNREASRSQRARFLREIKAISALRHPNIVRIFDVDLSDEACFYSMQYVDGVTLRKYLKQNPQNLRGAVRILATVARALHYAHGKGFLHRDIKPQNILVAKDGTPLLIDFGFAKRRAGDELVTRIGVTVGSPMYMAPEQAAGLHKKLCPQTDVYALGTILYLALTGRLPFAENPNKMAVVRAIQTTIPPEPRTLNPDAPEPLEAVCMRAMEKLIEGRYPTAEGFAEDLERWLQGSGLVELVKKGPPLSWSSTRLKALTPAEVSWWGRLLARIKGWFVKEVPPEPAPTAESSGEQRLWQG